MDQLRILFNKQINPSGWSTESITADLSSKVFVVTGGNTGIGFQTVLALAKHSPKRIFLTARSRSKYEEAMTKITQQVTNADKFVTYVEMDLASLASVKRASETIINATDRLDVLMNNAGIMGAPIQLTQDGYENHFGTNHMGASLLTKLLLPLLLRTAEQPGSDVRIINVSSLAHAAAPSSGFVPTQVTTDMKESGIMGRYGLSKLANILHARSLARKYPSIVSVALHPGRVGTGLLDGMYNDGRGGFFGQFQKVYDWTVTPVSVEKGALTQLWCATISKDALTSGAYYVPVGKWFAGSKISQNEAMADRLWDWQEGEFARLGYA